jgi:hypothetical protein
MPAPKPGRRVRGSATGRPIMALLDLLGRRMTLRILWELREDRRLTFRALQEAAETNPSVLNARLAELRSAHLVATAPTATASRPTARACSPPSCRSTPGPTSGPRLSPRLQRPSDACPLSPYGPSGERSVRAMTYGRVACSRDHNRSASVTRPVDIFWPNW